MSYGMLRCVDWKTANRSVEQSNKITGARLRDPEEQGSLILRNYDKYLQV